MLLKIKLLLFLICSIIFNSYSQKEGNIWTFGDSAAVDFNSATPSPYFGTGLYAHECSSTISDINGNLRFYVGANIVTGYFESAIFNKYNKIIQNGAGIFNNSSSSQGCILFPSPADTNEIYLITHRADASISNYQIYFSIINKSANNDSGAVIMKNIPLPGISNMAEQMTVIRHGNGNDWWLIAHKLITDQFYIYLVNSSGIHNPIVQSIGTSFSGIAAVGNMINSPDGNKLVLVGSNGIIDLFDFDRCKGTISNWITLGINNSSTFPSKYGCSFSPNSSMLYISDLDSGLFQYNLGAPNIINSKQQIWTNIDSLSIIGKHLIGNNGKVYIAHEKSGFNYVNMNLSVINSPDSLGLACDFQPYSFYLGGRRSFGGLPNIPDYKLGAIDCDSGVSVSEVPAFENNVSVYPNPASEKINITINYNSSLKVKLINVLGEELFIQEVQKQTTIDVSIFPKGVYFLHLEEKSGGSKTVKKVLLQ